MFRIRNPRAGRSRIPSRRSPPPACLSVGLVRGGPRGRARRHFLGRIASRALCLSTGYAPFPGYEGCPPYRSPLLGIRTLFSSRRRTSCRFSGQPALRDRSSRIPVHALIRDCGTIPCSYGSSSSKHCQPLPFQPPDGGHGSGPSAGPPQSSLPSPPGLRCTVAGNVPKPFCRT